MIWRCPLGRQSLWDGGRRPNPDCRSVASGAIMTDVADAQTTFNRRPRGGREGGGDWCFRDSSSGGADGRADQGPTQLRHGGVPGPATCGRSTLEPAAPVSVQLDEEGIELAWSVSDVVSACRWADPPSRSVCRLDRGDPARTGVGRRNGPRRLRAEARPLDGINGQLPDDFGQLLYGLGTTKHRLQTRRIPG